MPGSCRATHGLDVGVHVHRPVPSTMIGQSGGSSSGSVFQSCGYCGHVHRDSRKQQLYPLLPHQHLQESGPVQSSMFEVPAGRPSGVMQALQEFQHQQHSAVPSAAKQEV